MARAENVVMEEYFHVVTPHVRNGYQKYADAALAHVLAAYWQPHRVYHTVEHLANVLTKLRHWDRRLTDRQRLTAFVALLVHDVVYNIPAEDQSNEELSATWVSWFVHQCGISPQAIDQAEAESAVRITEGHQPDSLVSLVVCWCDLDGFTQGTKASREFSDQIRREYLTAYTPEQYEAGRRAFLASYRDPFKVYPGAPLSLRLEARWLNRKANRQLDRELAELSIDTVHPT